MITRYLPTFNQIEPDNLYGLTMGHVLAQIPVQYDEEEKSYGVVSVEKNGYKFFENGILCTISPDGKSVVDFTVVPVSQGYRPLFIHFTEELNTILPDRKFFAVEAAEGETFLRLVALVPGSEWTTNVACEEGPESAIYDAAIAGGRIRCINENAVLPDGRPAKTYRCIA